MITPCERAKRPKAPPKWTAEEDLKLAELKAAGKSAQVIAKALNRTETAIVSRLGVLRKRACID